MEVLSIKTGVNGKPIQVVKEVDKSLIGLGNVDNTSDLNKPISTATQTALDLKIGTDQKGVASGVAELDSSGKVPSSQLPSYVDDVLEFPTREEFPTMGESGKIYIALDTNKTYRWSGSTYVEIGSSLALGETDSTAYRGDRGKTAYDHSQVTSGNPHNVTATDIGLGNVVNTGDSATPVSGGTTKFTTGGAYTELGKKVDTAGTGLSKSGTTLNHSNSVEADETLTLKSFTYDAQGHITGSGNKNLGRGISDEAGFIGHSNTAVAAQTTQNVQAIKYDAYGHITAGAARPIVTAWSSTTADTNIPSEKLVKTALDTKIDTAGTGLSKSGTTLNHSNSITAGTAGTSSATSGTNTLAVPYVTYDAQGHVTAAGTHTHTIGNASASALGVMKVGTGLSASSGTVNHSNSVTAQTTATLCKIKFDAQGHITGVTAMTPEEWTIVYENGTTATKKVVVL